jgi:hypothetical protein
MRRLLVASAIFALALPVFSANPEPAPKPDADDAAIETTVNAVYDVISGPAGTRDWARFRALFATGAQMAAYRKGTALTMTPEVYTVKSSVYFDKNGFFERPVETHIDRFHDIAHVTSRYESRHDKSDATPFARGVNHFELIRSGDHWLVLSIVWEEE